MIDLFWEQPFAFSTFVHSRYTEQMTDAFSRPESHEFEHQPSPSMTAFRKLLKREYARQYQTLMDHPLPIGSRYHPERVLRFGCPIPPVEGTEEWISRGRGSQLTEV